MEVLRQKPDTKRPAIVAAATSLFASKGADATSMRDVADDAGVREAAIYRHFRGKEEMAQEIFASWYGWYSRQVQEIVKRGDSMQRKLRALVHAEFDAVRAHPQEFLYFCENEARFLRGLPRDVPRVRRELVKMLRKGQHEGTFVRGMLGCSQTCWAMRCAQQQSRRFCGTIRGFWRAKNWQQTAAGK